MKGNYQKDLSLMGNFFICWKPDQIYVLILSQKYIFISPSHLPYTISILIQILVTPKNNVIDVLYSTKINNIFQILSNGIILKIIELNLFYHGMTFTTEQASYKKISKMCPISQYFSANTFQEHFFLKY